MAFQEFEPAGPTRLEQAERAVREGDRDAVVIQYADAVLHEIINPLEAINNLIYLLRQTGVDAASSLVYTEMVQSQIEKLNDIVLRSLLFCKEQEDAGRDGGI